MIRYGLSLVSEPIEPTGIGIYGLELVRAIAPQLSARERLVVFRHVDFPAPTPHPRLIDVPIRFPAGRSSVRRAYEQVLLPWWGARERVRVLHAVNHVVPLFAFSSLVVNLYDTRLYAARRRADLGRRLFRDIVYPASVRRARACIVLTHVGAREFERLFGIEPERLHVIPPGGGQLETHMRAATPRDDHARSLIGQFARLEGGYLLHAGKQDRHKNLVRLVEAYARMRRRRPRAPALVLAGARGESTEAIGRTARAHGVEDAVLLPGYVEETALSALFRHASAFVFPSTLEGFGLPVLEAMAAGKPVLCSDLPVLREVAEDAVIYADPLDVEAISRGLERIVYDEALREKLVRAGARRVRAFGWERTARQTLALYRRLAGKRRWSNRIG